jgi:hypothetical protein
MTPGTKSGGGAEKDKHSAENNKNSAENDEIQVPKKSAETGGNLRNKQRIMITIAITYRSLSINTHESLDDTRVVASLSI